MPLSIKRLLTPRFSIKSLLVLVLGIAIGYSLNLYTLRVLMGPGSESAMKALPTYVIEPPDVVAIDVIGEAAGFASVAGKHLVGPDGRVSLGEHGSLYIAGLTLEEARAAIEKKLTSGGQGVKLAVDVAAYNSKKYYVITKGKKFGDNILQLPITGNDTVLDALASVDGVKSVDAKIYISRPSAKPNGVAAILPVIYEEVVRGVTRTNYQLLPGDRLFVEPPTKATPAPAPSGFQPTRQPPPTPAPNYYSYVRPQLQAQDTASVPEADQGASAG